MEQQDTVTNRILKAVRRTPRCQIDALDFCCPELTWNQVSLEVARLSRTRQVRVRPKGPATYTLTVQPKPKRWSKPSTRSMGRGL